MNEPCRYKYQGNQNILIYNVLHRGGDWGAPHETKAATPMLRVLQA